MYKENKNQDFRLRAMWTMHITNNITSDELNLALTDSDEYVRAWAIQMLCEDSNPSDKTIEMMHEMSFKDPSAVVRLYLSAAIQRINLEARWEIITGLISKTVDIEDPNIPKMIWFGMEPLVEINPSRAIRLASSSKIPLISEFTSRRLVDANNLNLLVEELGKEPEQLKFMLKGLLSGLEGRSDIIAPQKWETVYAKLKSNDEVSSLSIEIAQLFGDTEAAQKFLILLKTRSAPIEKRKDALQSLVAKQREELIPILPDLLKESELSVESIRAMASFDHIPFGRLLIDNFDEFNKQEQAEALQTLSSRTSYGQLFTHAIKEEIIKKNEVPAYVARQLRRVVGNGFVEVWGPIDQLSGNKNLAYQRYQKLLTKKALAASDLQNGKQLFQRTCIACHKLYDEGGSLGPDITGANRGNLDYLLNNLIEPSGEIQDDYKMVVITSRDGRTYSGNIIAESDRQLTMRVIGQDQLVINKSDIQSQETAAVSMMPEGLLETFSDQEILDLIAYLQTDKQIEDK